MFKERCLGRIAPKIKIIPQPLNHWGQDKGYFANMGGSNQYPSIKVALHFPHPFRNPGISPSTQIFTCLSETTPRKQFLKFQL